jgi:hypothetical protein
MLPGINNNDYDAFKSGVGYFSSPKKVIQFISIVI